MIEQKESPLLSYPPYQGVRTGCKVSWYYYKSTADADKACQAARHNARYLRGRGYDFGYQSPGYKVDYIANEKSEHFGLYEVCVP